MHIYASHISCIYNALARKKTSNQTTNKTTSLASTTGVRRNKTIMVLEIKAIICHIIRLAELVPAVSGKTLSYVGNAP